MCHTSTVSQMWESFRSVKGKSPKTVLGFLWSFAALALAGFLGFSWICTVSPSLIPAFPWVAVFCGVIVVGVGATTVVAMFKDPSRLLLTTVAATDYVDIQRLRLGDSSSGERVVGAGPETLVVIEESASDGSLDDASEGTT